MHHLQIQSNVLSVVQEVYLTPREKPVGHSVVQTNTMIGEATNVSVARMDNIFLLTDRSACNVVKVVLNAPLLTHVLNAKMDLSMIIQEVHAEFNATALLSMIGIEDNVLTVLQHNS